MPKKKAKKRAAKRRVVKRAVKKKAIKRSPVKRKAKKPAAKKVKKPAVAKKPKEKVIGIVTHYFPHVQAAVVKLKAPLVIGDNIKIKGHTTEFTQAVTSMQIDRVPITEGKKGDEIGMQVVSRVRQHDLVCKP